MTRLLRPALACEFRRKTKTAKALATNPGQVLIKEIHGKAIDLLRIFTKNTIFTTYKGYQRGRRGPTRSNFLADHIRESLRIAAAWVEDAGFED